MPTFKYAKLVRDNIADWHENAGHTANVTQLSDRGRLSALCSKLREEAAEVAAATDTHELIEELADVHEVLRAICENEDIPLSTVEAVRKQKLMRKGGFKRGVYIDSVHIPDESDKWAKYCRASPEKYPEIFEDSKKLKSLSPAAEPIPPKSNPAPKEKKAIGNEE